MKRYKVWFDRETREIETVGRAVTAAFKRDGKTPRKLSFYPEDGEMFVTAKDELDAYAQAKRWLEDDGVRQWVRRSMG